MDEEVRFVQAVTIGLQKLLVLPEIYFFSGPSMLIYVSGPRLPESLSGSPHLEGTGHWRGEPDPIVLYKICVGLELIHLSRRAYRGERDAEKVDRMGFRDHRRYECRNPAAFDLMQTDLDRLIAAHERRRRRWVKQKMKPSSKR